MIDSPAELLGPSGPLATRLPGFAPREQQQAMAEAVAEALAESGVLVAEAGTGTGKTFAYLVPALLFGGKVVISTGTRNLQDQLFHRDLPLVRDALGVAVDVALLKGRANYLCPHRLQLAADGRFRTPEDASHLHAIQRWAVRTGTGDIAEVADIADNAPIWPYVTSSADNCLGLDCDHAAECFLIKARRRAQEADLLVVNHHLLFADMALRDEGFGELLPGANAFILDEAHQLPETASHFFGISVTGNQLLELARDSAAEEIKEAGDSREVRRAADILEQAVRDFRLALGRGLRRAPWREAGAESAVTPAIADVAAALGRLMERLDPLAGRGKGLENCRRRCAEARERFRLTTEAPPEDHVHWFETHTRSFSLNLTPMDIAPLFRQRMDERPTGWVFTSATLAVGEDFSHFTRRLGVDLEAAATRRWESPYDYPLQAVLYAPPDIPEPAHPDYTATVVEAALPVIEAAGGRTFLLFTSHRALREAAELLEGRLDYPVLVQGEGPRARLLEQFRALGNAVLLGTGSFWEGVDVRGEALSCVVIDKLPFASPGDPVLQARIDAMRQGGGNPFREYQLPQAVIALKQGAGRLIRDATDYGVLMLCDPRLGTRSYGRTFLESLPPMTRTRRLEVVERFFALHRPDT